MTAAETSKISARNWAFFQAYARKEAEMKCYDCPKFTYYGKTCKGKCDRE